MALTEIRFLQSETANSELIDHLTMMLEQARKGEITEMVYYVYWPESQEWSHGWTALEQMSEAERLGVPEAWKRAYWGESLEG